MSTHKVDFTLAAEDLTAARGHITGLIQTLGVHLVGMQDRDRKTLRRMGGKSEQFVMEALELAKANAPFIPPSIDLTALERDKTARTQLLPLYMQLAAFTKLLSDTLDLCGVDLMAGGLDCYKTLKFFGKAAGIEDLVKELGKTFARASRETDDTTTPPSTLPPLA